MHEYLKSFLNWNVDYDPDRAYAMVSTAIFIKAQQGVSKESLYGPEGDKIEKTLKAMLVENIARKMYELLEIDDTALMKLHIVNDIPLETLLKITADYRIDEWRSLYRQNSKEECHG